MENIIIACLMCVARENVFFLIDGKGECGFTSTQHDVLYYEVVPGKSAHNMCFALQNLSENSTTPPTQPPPSCPSLSCPSPSIWTTLYETIIIQLSIQIILLVFYKLFKNRAKLILFYRARVYNVQRRRERTPDSPDTSIEEFLRPSPRTPRSGPVINDIINLPNLSPEIDEVLIPTRPNPTPAENPVVEVEMNLLEEIVEDVNSPAATPVAARTRTALKEAISKPSWFGNRMH